MCEENISQCLGHRLWQEHWSINLYKKWPFYSSLILWQVAQKLVSRREAKDDTVPNSSYCLESWHEVLVWTFLKVALKLKNGWCTCHYVGLVSELRWDFFPASEAPGYELSWPDAHHPLLGPVVVCMWLKGLDEPIFFDQNGWISRLLVSPEVGNSIKFQVPMGFVEGDCLCSASSTIGQSPFQLFTTFDCVEKWSFA